MADQHLQILRYLLLFMCGNNETVSEPDKDVSCCAEQRRVLSLHQAHSSRHYACATLVLLSWPVTSLSRAPMSPEMPRVRELRPPARPPASAGRLLSRRSGDEWWLRADRGVDACAWRVRQNVNIVHTRATTAATSSSWAHVTQQQSGVSAGQRHSTDMLTKG